MKDSTADGQVRTHSSYNELTPEEAHVIEHKGTELPFSGAYWNHFAEGTYHCRRCGAVLYSSAGKFACHCGWPAFDEAHPGAVRQLADKDGVRTEIVCAACGGHLGHVFAGERLTPKNMRHCVNALSLQFVPAGDDEHAGAAAGIGDAAGGIAPERREIAYFAGGCFWGIEHLMRRRPGVESAVSGYMGGHTAGPDYESVCTGTTGHAEVVRVDFFPAETSFEELCRFFFEIHDPTQLNRQGWDSGTQYRSALFYTSEAQRDTALRLIEELRHNGYNVVTEVVPAATFHKAEEYHQRYLERRPGHGCAVPVKRFERRRE